MNLKLAICVSFFCLTICFDHCRADDWPQINGVGRDGVAVGEKLLRQWPTGGLKEVWSHPVGQGYSGPVVVGEKLIVFHRPGKNYLVEALNSKTGKLIWNKSLPSVYQAGGPDPDNGPKAVPLVHDGRIYLLGTGGNLFCIKLDDGTVIWQKDVLDIYSAPSGYFGAGSTPIVIGEKLLVNVGGKDSAVVAFDLKTGKEIWKAFDDRASYSSPIEMEVNGKSLAVFITRLHCVAVDSANGKVVGKVRFGKSGATVNGAMPLKIGQNSLFANAAYGVGGKVIEIASDNVVSSPIRTEDFASQYSTPVLLGGKLYGTSGREDFSNGSFRCIDLVDGSTKLLWKQDQFPIGHSILVGKQIVVLDSSGMFHVVDADPKAFKQVYQTRLFESKSRSMPALANGLFYARSNAVGGKGELVCVKVGPQK